MKKLFGALALSFALLALVGCSKKEQAASGGEGDKTILVQGAFRGEEQARFEEIIKIFNEKTGYNVVYEGSPDFEVQIQVQTEAGTPPDVAALPQPGTMKRFAAAGYLKPLSANVVKAIDANYAPVWKELGTGNDGKVYGVFHRVNAKSFVWY